MYEYDKVTMNLSKKHLGRSYKDLNNFLKSGRIVSLFHHIYIVLPRAGRIMLKAE